MRARDPPAGGANKARRSTYPMRRRRLGDIVEAAVAPGSVQAGEGRRGRAEVLGDLVRVYTFGRVVASTRGAYKRSLAEWMKGEI